MSEQSERTEIASTALLARLVKECRGLISASGLDGGAGGGWEAHDPLLTNMRKIVHESESHLVNAELSGGAAVRSDALLDILSEADEDGDRMTNVMRRAAEYLDGEGFGGPVAGKLRAAASRIESVLSNDQAQF